MRRSSFPDKCNQLNNKQYGHHLHITWKTKKSSGVQEQLATEFPEDLDQYFQMGKLQKCGHIQKSKTGYKRRNAEDTAEPYTVMPRGKDPTSAEEAPFGSDQPSFRKCTKTKDTVAGKVQVNNASKIKSCTKNKLKQDVIDTEYEKNSSVVKCLSNLKEINPSAFSNVTAACNTKPLVRNKVKHVTFDLKDTVMSSQNKREQDPLKSKSGNDVIYKENLKKNVKDIIAQENGKTDANLTAMEQMNVKSKELWLSKNTYLCDQAVVPARPCINTHVSEEAVVPYVGICHQTQVPCSVSCEEAVVPCMNTCAARNVVPAGSCMDTRGAGDVVPAGSCSLAEGIPSDFQAALGYCEEKGVRLGESLDDQDSEPPFPLAQNKYADPDSSRRADISEKACFADSWSDYDEQSLEVALAYAEAVEIMQKKRKSVHLKEP